MNSASAFIPIRILSLGAAISIVTLYSASSPEVSVFPEAFFAAASAIFSPTCFPASLINLLSAFGVTLTFILVVIVLMSFSGTLAVITRSLVSSITKSTPVAFSPTSILTAVTVPAHSEKICASAIFRSICAICNSSTLTSPASAA